MKIRFVVNGLEFGGELNNSKTAIQIYEKLPLSSEVELWGEEIYFEIGVKLPEENPTLDVGIGDIAYWPEGGCMCIFFGRTPISRDEKPIPASLVNIIGHIAQDATILKKIKEGSKISVIKDE